MAAVQTDKELLNSILEKKKAVKKNISKLSYDLEALLKKQKHDIKIISKKDQAYFTASEKSHKKEMLNEYGREIKEYIDLFETLIKDLEILWKLEIELEKLLKREVDILNEHGNEEILNIAHYSGKVKESIKEFLHNHVSDGIYKKGQLIALISLT